MSIATEYRYPVTPVCNPNAVVAGPDYRITLLTSALIRVEYSPDGCFEDRATQTVVNRAFALPSFTMCRQKGGLRIVTEDVELTYHGGPFTCNSLMLRLRKANLDWHWGDESQVLPGTTRTLDGVDGACPLNHSILARRGVAVMDDGQSLILREDGWVQPRRNGAVDVYLFCHHHDYLRALKDYCDLTGHIPMLPRYAFGNWWSRYHKYTQQEYSELMARFRRQEIPFSVAVIDMDWHKSKIDPKYGSGWTGFTWDKDAFPDHVALLKELHDAGMEVTLNLHPAQGFAAHEACYPEMAERMGIDPVTEQRIPFDVTDPTLLENYFKCVLHPMEKEGVSFWWMDWQQGNTTAIPGLDPLWMLNHFHFCDIRNSGRRPMIFSRYSGHGSQRYPVGFSGDTYVTWDSLRFQPYFTNMASNVDYGWWSHDIGGHCVGSKDDELTGRWVQYGAFSPINRLHSTDSPFMTKEPWRFNRDTEACMKRFLRLRHRLIPYLYTMNRRTAESCMPIISPLYFYEPQNEAAYRFPNEYYFGTQLLVSPITEPADPVTRMGSVSTWLPEGLWFDVFTGTAYEGGRSIRNYRTLDEMPVFARAGAILPLAVTDNVNDTDNPRVLELQVFPGADGSFVLYEDDGRTNACDQGEYAETAISWHWAEDEALLSIHAPTGAVSLIPQGRTYTVTLRCLSAAAAEANVPCRITQTDQGIRVDLEHTEGDIRLRVIRPAIQPNRTNDIIFDILDRAHCSHPLKDETYKLVLSGKPLTSILTTLDVMDMSEHLYRALLEQLTAMM